METTNIVTYAYSQDAPDIDTNAAVVASSETPLLSHEMVAGTAAVLDAATINKPPPSPLSTAEIPAEPQDQQDIEIQEDDEQNSSLYNTGTGSYNKDVSDHHQLHHHPHPPAGGLSTMNYKTSSINSTLSSSKIIQDHPGYIIQDNPSLHVVQPSNATAQYPNPKTVYLHHHHHQYQSCTSTSTSSISLDGSQQHYQHQQQQLSHKDAAAQFRKSSVPNATQIQFHAEALLRRGSLPPLPSTILLVKTSAGQSSGQGTPSSSAGSTLSSVASMCLSEPQPPIFSPEKMSAAAPPNMSRRSSSGAITPLATLKEKATDSDISLEDLSQVKSAAF